MRRRKGKNARKERREGEKRTAHSCKTHSVFSIYKRTTTTTT
jgi:hypothetical protein